MRIRSLLPGSAAAMAAAIATTGAVTGIVDDAAPEGDETFTARLADPDGGNAVPAATGTTATVTITDDDALTAGFAVTAVRVDEGTAEASLEVALNGPAPAGGVTVRYRTSDVEATAGQDYTAVGAPPGDLAELDIAAGERRGFIRIPITDDDVPPTAGFATTAVMIEEGPTAEVTLTVDMSRAAPAGGIALTWRTVAGTTASFVPVRTNYRSGLKRRAVTSFYPPMKLSLLRSRLLAAA